MKTSNDLRLSITFEYYNLKIRIYVYNVRLIVNCINKITLLEKQVQECTQIDIHKQVLSYSKSQSKQQRYL